MPAEHVPHVRVELAVCRPPAEQNKSRLVGSVVDRTDQHRPHADPILHLLHLPSSLRKSLVRSCASVTPRTRQGKRRVTWSRTREIRGFDRASGRPRVPATRLSSQDRRNELSCWTRSYRTRKI